MSPLHSRSSLIWRQWVRTSRLCRKKVVLINAADGALWTAAQLDELIQEHLRALPPARPGERIAFRLTGASGLALFLALQRAGYVAVPLDLGIPKEGCLELARRVDARALLWEGKYHLLPGGKISRTAACVKLTSGSEGGDPKIIECRAEHLIADGRQIIATMKLRPQDRHLAAIPLGHSYGLGNLVMPLILQGATLILAEHFVPNQLVSWLDDFHATVFPGVPALFRVLAARPGLERPKKLRVAISAGAPLPAETARAFWERYGVSIHNFYGSSETGGICYDRTGKASLTGRSVGTPLEGVKVSIRAGKITVKSRAVTTRSGSWVLPDIGEWNKYDEVVLMGRTARDANIGGKKVHPGEIERALRAIPQVTDASVWILHHGGRDYLGAAVESSLSQVMLERQLAERLPTWKMPRRFFIAEELPRTSRGKLETALLKKQLEAEG